MGLTFVLNLVLIKTLTLLLSTKLCVCMSMPYTNINISDTILCPDYGSIEFATIKSFDIENSRLHVIHVECDVGYELFGRPKLLCKNGKWESAPRPICIPMCQPPPNVENGRLSLEGDKDRSGYFKKATLATYNCNAGFQLSPPESKYRVCEKGIWTGATATCAPIEQITSCNRPKDIANGYYVQEKNNVVDGFGIGQRLHYSCNSGFVLDGSSVQQCLEDGTWSPRIPPNCIPDESVLPKYQSKRTGRREMAGQTINDRLLAAKHSLAGQGLAKSVCKSTTEELLGPKKKHLDYLVHCTNEPNVSIPQMANLLIERSQNTNWVVVFKALITTHHVMCYGNERFTQYLASSNSTFNLTNFVDKSSTQGVAGARQGYDMSPFIRRYARYLNEKAMSYRSVAFDFCKVKRGKEEGTLRTMNAEKLLKTLPTLQSHLDALLEFDCTANDLTNGVINMCFMLLFRDLIRLFACYNDGIINLLEKYFDMNKKQCRDALDLYKKFLIRMDRVGEFLKVAENIGIDKGDIPDLTKAPNSLLDALEQHLTSLEGNTPTQTASNQKNLKSGVNALSSTSNAFGTAAANNNQIDETLKQQVVAEEEAAMNQYKAKVQSPSSSTNPFLMSSSPVKTQPIETQPILDLFGAPPVNATGVNQQTKASDDLLQLGNPFADMFAGQQPANNVATTQPATNMFAANGAASAQTNNMWASNGFAAQPAPSVAPPATTTTNVFATNNLIGVFDNSEPSVFDPMQSDVLKPAASQGAPVPVMGSQTAAPAKVLTGDLESSLASLAENLTISSSSRNTPVQWNSPKNQPKPSAVGWQPQPMAATTGANYRPMGQPVAGGMPYPMGAQPPMMGSPRMGAPQAVAQPTQPPKQEVSFDPFGDL